MKTGILIPMNRPDRLLEKARFFLVNLEAFLCNTSVGVTVLLDALPHADKATMLKMIPLLGYAGKDRVLWPFYRLIMDSSKDEQVRSSAAVQFGLAASMSIEPSVLKAELIDNLSHPDPLVRSCCALALGWKGNGSAVNVLMAYMTDPDQNVQASVVAALSSVGDTRVFELLTGRLESGTVEEQRSILLNLWRFSDQISRLEDVYLRCMEKCPPFLRLDALSGLAMIPLSTTILENYRRLLLDTDPLIRHQVLDNLFLADPDEYGPLKKNIRFLLADKNDRVRQAATRLFAKN